MHTYIHTGISLQSQHLVLIRHACILLLRNLFAVTALSLGNGSGHASDMYPPPQESPCSHST